MENKIKNIFYLQGAILIFSFAGIFSKKASEFDFLSIKYLIFYGLSMLVMMIYAVLWQQILKKFSLTVAYANKGTLPLITMFWGWWLFNERISINMIIGSAIIIGGILLVVSEDD